jgi:hypothetical protein
MPQYAVDDMAIVQETAQWAHRLRTVTDLRGARFPRAEPRQRAATYVQGLLSPLERKNGWHRAAHAGDDAP